MKRKREFEDLVKAYPGKKLEMFCIEITRLFATSCGKKYICQMDGLSKDCFDDIIEYAIVRNAVEDDIAYKAFQKSLESYKSEPEKYKQMVERWKMIDQERKKHTNQIVEEE